MLSALIQTARGPEPPSELKGEAPNKRRQLRLDSNFRVSRKGAQSNTGPSATLIVAPTSLLSQWSEELKRSSKSDTLKVIVWHGQNRLDLESLVGDGDSPTVVITSYGTLVSEYTRWSDKVASPVFESTSANSVDQFNDQLTFCSVEWLRTLTACPWSTCRLTKT